VQERLIRNAYRDADLSPNNAGYFECHGTGTPVEDPLEVGAIRRVFGADSERIESTLLVGSVKTNLGNWEAGSGIVEYSRRYVPS
jgi:acyl transferase domain-containing protein